MTTIGSLIDHARAKSHLDEYFTRMKSMANNEKLAIRMRFMLQEVIDLRRGGWKQRVADPAVKMQQQQQAQMGKGGKGKGGGPPSRGAPPPARGAGPPGRGGAGPSAPPAAPAAPAPLSKEKVAARLETELEEYFNLGQVEELLLNLKELREKAPETPRQRHRARDERAH